MISLQNISKSFDAAGNRLQVIKDLSLIVEKGDMIAIMGRSGAGKSTLLHIMAGFIRPDGGQYLFSDENTEKYKEQDWAKLRNKGIGYILQNNGLLFDRNVMKNILLPLTFSGLTRAKRIEKVHSITAMLGIEDKLTLNPSKLSGGEQQRTAVARALVMDAPVLLADEPTGSLDSKTEENILSLLLDLNGQGKTLIIVTHDRVVADICHRVYYIEDGHLVLR